jgi:hypothetical protein
MSEIQYQKNWIPTKKKYNLKKKIINYNDKFQIETYHINISKSKPKRTDIYKKEQY